MSEFEDQFSKQATLFKKYRPGYPEELFQYICTLVEEKKLAWDCGTGNGQAARSLSPYFEKIIATDASFEQIKNAHHTERVEFRVATAEDSGLEANSIDLVTVASALHWFNKPLFFQEVKRVLKPGGIFAAWTYEEFRTDKQIDEKFKLIYNDIREYWSGRLHDARTKYREIDLPIEELPSPGIDMALNWDLEHCLGYLRTWSAVQNYINKTATDPTRNHYDEIRKVWGDPNEKREVRWNLHFKIGRKDKER